jgi:hypothetical protein
MELALGDERSTITLAFHARTGRAGHEAYLGEPSIARARWMDADR